jgi:hypothetical protein
MPNLTAYDGAGKSNSGASRKNSEVVHVLLSSLPLCYSLAQCFVLGLDGTATGRHDNQRQPDKKQESVQGIPAANVYSSWKCDPVVVLQDIKRRFGEDTGSFGSSFIFVQQQQQKQQPDEEAKALPPGVNITHDGGGVVGFREEQLADACRSVRADSFSPLSHHSAVIFMRADKIARTAR